MHKFFVPAININDSIASIEGEDVKHINKVLRLKIGEKVSINDCEGKEYIGTIGSIDKRLVLVNILHQLDKNNESPVNIYLYQGLPKSTKMDYIVQKLTELGVKEITPVITNRVVIKNQNREFKKTDRWNRIALEACKQCKRSIIPKVKDPMEFDKAIDEMKSMDLILVPYENKHNYGIKSLMKNIANIKENIKNIAIIVGPEGGFEEYEIEKLQDDKTHIITLGPRILRTETAGIICSSIILYELGDLGGIL